MEKKSSYGKKAGGKGPVRGDKSFKGGERKSGPYGKREDSKGAPRGDSPNRGAGEGRGGAKSFDSARPRKRSFEKEEGDNASRRSFDRKDSGPRSYKKREDGFKPAFKREEGENAARRSFDNKDSGARPYKKREEGSKPAFKREDGENSARRSFDNKDSGARPYKKREEGSKPPYRKDDGDRPYKKREEGFKPAFKKDDGDRPYKKREEGFKPAFKKDDGDRPYKKREEGFKSTFKKDDGDRPYKKREEGFKSTFKKDDRRADFNKDRDSEDAHEVKLPKKEIDPSKTAFNTPHKYKRLAAEGEAPKSAKAKDKDTEPKVPKGPMTLNKFISHSGECSRRDAAELVKQGKVKVNGELITEPGYRVLDTDQVTLLGKKLKPIKDLVYVLLNKPKGYITTTDDPQERATVMDLVQGVEADRLYPVGRLDRNTSGLLLLTNDGDLAQKLSHPSYETKKLYQVTLDKPLTKSDFDKITAGIELEDGLTHVDELAYLDTKEELGLEIHSGKNRIVRRIFETLGYDVVKLDRVIYAGLTKKNLPRGKWRFLEEKEIVLLKHFKQ